MTRRTVYALLSVALFATEVLIATKLAHLQFVRASLGDVIVTALPYCFALSLRDFERLRLAAAVFAFACSIELSQYLHLADALGLAPGGALRIVIGSSFEWSDVVCYFVGCAVALGVDTALGARLSKPGVLG